MRPMSRHGLAAYTFDLMPSDAPDVLRLELDAARRWNVGVDRDHRGMRAMLDVPDLSLEGPGRRNARFPEHLPVSRPKT